MIESINVPLELFTKKDLSPVEVILLCYIKDKSIESNLFIETDQQISKALNINSASLPTLISKLRKLIYLELVYTEDKERILRYVPVPKDSDTKSPQGFIYVMEDTALPGYYKIGFSKNVSHREGTLQGEKPTIRLIKKFVGSIQQEHSVHRYLDRFRIRGEWFKGIPLEEIEKAIKKIIGI